MNEYTELLNHWSTIIAAALIGLVWVIVTTINRCCHHTWENMGEPKEREVTKIETEEGVRLSRSYTVIEHHQALRCTKCGEITNRKVW